jgi:hypothetical protein
MPTFLDEQRRDTPAFDQESFGDEWETAEKEYNAMSEGGGLGDMFLWENIST